MKTTLTLLIYLMCFLVDSKNCFAQFEKDSLFIEIKEIFTGNIVLPKRPLLKNLLMIENNESDIFVSIIVTSNERSLPLSTKNAIFEISDSISIEFNPVIYEISLGNSPKTEQLDLYLIRYNAYLKYLVPKWNSPPDISPKKDIEITEFYMSKIFNEENHILKYLYLINFLKLNSFRLLISKEKQIGILDMISRDFDNNASLKNSILLIKKDLEQI